MYSKLKESIKPDLHELNYPAFVKLNEEILKEHLAQISVAKSLKELTLKQRKQHASKPVFLVRYE